MRLVILTSSRYGVAADCLRALSESTVCTIARVIICAGRPPNRLVRWRRKLRKTLRIGPIGALNGIRLRRWYAGADDFEVGAVCLRLGIPVFETERMGSPEMAELMCEAGADLGVSLGNSYIPERIFSIPSFGMINLHGERLPEYQNAQSVIWPIYNREMMTGVSVHRIDRGIDTGPILFRDDYPIVFHARLEYTVRATLAEGRRRIPDAIRFVCENFAELAAAAAPQTGGRIYTTPTMRQFLRMCRNNRRLYERSLAEPGRSDVSR